MKKLRKPPTSNAEFVRMFNWYEYWVLGIFGTSTNLHVFLVQRNLWLLSMSQRLKWTFRKRKVNGITFGSITSVAPKHLASGPWVTLLAYILRLLGFSLCVGWAKPFVCWFLDLDILDMVSQCFFLGDCQVMFHLPLGQVAMIRQRISATDTVVNPRPV